LLVPEQPPPQPAPPRFARSLEELAERLFADGETDPLLAPKKGSAFSIWSEKRWGNAPPTAGLHLEDLVPFDAARHPSHRTARQ